METHKNFHLETPEQVVRKISDQKQKEMIALKESKSLQMKFVKPANALEDALNQNMRMEEMDRVHKLKDQTNKLRKFLIDCKNNESQFEVHVPALANDWELRGQSLSPSFRPRDGKDNCFRHSTGHEMNPDATWSANDQDGSNHVKNENDANARDPESNNEEEYHDLLESALKKMNEDKLVESQKIENELRQVTDKLEMAYLDMDAERTQNERKVNDLQAQLKNANVLAKEELRMSNEKYSDVVLEMQAEKAKHDVALKEVHEKYKNQMGQVAETLKKNNDGLQAALVKMEEERTMDQLKMNELQQQMLLQNQRAEEKLRSAHCKLEEALAAANHEKQMQQSNAAEEMRKLAFRIQMAESKLEYTKRSEKTCQVLTKKATDQNNKHEEQILKLKSIIQAQETKKPKNCFARK